MKKRYRSKQSSDNLADSSGMRLQQRVSGSHKLSLFTLSFTLCNYIEFDALVDIEQSDMLETNSLYI